MGYTVQYFISKRRPKPLSRFLFVPVMVSILNAVGVNIESPQPYVRKQKGLKCLLYISLSAAGNRGLVGEPSRS